MAETVPLQPCKGCGGMDECSRPRSAPPGALMMMAAEAEAWERSVHARVSWRWLLTVAAAGGLFWVAIGYAALRAWVWVHG